MKKLSLLLMLTAFSFVIYSQTAQLPVTVTPTTATSADEITLTLDANVSCPADTLLGFSSILMHSGYTIDAGGWQNVVDAMSGDTANTGHDGTSTELTSNGDGTFSITFTPDLFYDTTGITAINCVFNAGIHTTNQWDAEGKAFDESNANCMDITVPLPFGNAAVNVVYKGIQNVNAYPNPFIENTILSYALNEESNVNISIYNALGQKIITLINENQSIGDYEVELNGSNLSNGLYFYRIETGNLIESGRLLKE